MAFSATKSEVAAIRSTVQGAFNELSKAKRDEKFNDLLDVMVFFRQLEHDADDDPKATAKPQAA